MQREIPASRKCARLHSDDTSTAAPCLRILFSSQDDTLTLDVPVANVEPSALLRELQAAETVNIDVTALGLIAHDVRTAVELRKGSTTNNTRGTAIITQTDLNATASACAQRQAMQARQDQALQVVLEQGWFSMSDAVTLRQLDKAWKILCTEHAWQDGKLPLSWRGRSRGDVHPILMWRALFPRAVALELVSDTGVFPRAVALELAPEWGAPADWHVTDAVCEGLQAQLDHTCRVTTAATHVYCVHRRQSSSVSMTQ